MNYIIETKNLTKQYGTNSVVQDVNLHLPKGKIYGLLGRNGAGKTTLMKMILQLIKPTNGSINIFNQDFKNNRELIYPRIGSIIETPGFYGNLTAFENLNLLQKLRNNKDLNNIYKVLELVGLQDEVKKPYNKFSLGLKQRLGIASAIIHEPDILILDEPINGLDPIGISEIRSFLLELCKEKGITILISSHILNEIEQMTDIIGIMHNGHLIEEVNLKELNRRKYLEIEVSNVLLATKILEKKYGIKTYNLEDKSLKIYEKLHNSAQINKTLNDYGILVSKIILSEENLEDYFSEKIGGYINV